MSVCVEEDFLQPKTVSACLAWLSHSYVLPENIFMNLALVSLELVEGALSLPEY